MEEINFPIRLILSIFAVYRLAQMFAYDDGLYFIFASIRNYTDKQRKEEQEQDIKNGKWASVDELVRCPFCQGVWLSILFALLVTYPTVYGDVPVLIFGIAGAQAYLQGIR